MEKINQQMVTENRKIVSVVDGFPAHKNLELSNLKQVLLDSNMTSSIQPLDLMPFAIVKSKYKSWWNSSICEEKDCDVAVCMRKIISIITNLGDDIWLKAWKRSGLIFDYLSELEQAESEILREEINFEEEGEEILESQEEPEAQEEPEEQEEPAITEETDNLDLEISNTQKKLKQMKIESFFKKP